MQLHVCLFLHTKRVQILPTMPWFWRCPVLQCATFRSRQLSRKHHKIWLLDRYPFWGQNFEGLHCRFKATDGLPTWGTTKEKSYIPYQYSSQPRSVPIFHQKLAPFKQWKPRTGRLVRKRACYCAGLNSKVIWTRSWGDVKFSTSFEACASGNLHDKGYSAWLQVTKGKPLDFSHDRYIYIYTYGTYWFSSLVQANLPLPAWSCSSSCSSSSSCLSSLSSSFCPICWTQL